MYIIVYNPLTKIFSTQEIEHKQRKLTYLVSTPMSMGRLCVGSELWQDVGQFVVVGSYGGLPLEPYGRPLQLGPSSKERWGGVGLGRIRRALDRIVAVTVVVVIEEWWSSVAHSALRWPAF